MLFLFYSFHIRISLKRVCRVFIQATCFFNHSHSVWDSNVCVFVWIACDFVLRSTPEPRTQTYVLTLRRRRRHSFVFFSFIRMHVGMWMCTFMRHTVHTCKCVNGYINRTYDYIGVFWRLCKYSQWIDTILYYYTIAEATHRRPHATIRKRNKKSTFLTFPIPSALASTSCLSFIVPYDFNRFYSLVSLQSNSIRDPHAFAFGAPHLDTSVDLKTPSAISIWKCIHVCWLLSSYFDSHCCCCCFFLWWLNFVRCFNLTRAKFFSMYNSFRITSDATNIQI